MNHAKRFCAVFAVPSDARRVRFTHNASRPRIQALATASRGSPVSFRRALRPQTGRASSSAGEGSSLFPVEWLLGFSLRDHALDGAPTLAVCLFPASRRPIRTQLGALNSRAFWPPFPPILHQTVLRAAPEPHRSTSVRLKEVLR